MELLLLLLWAPLIYATLVRAKNISVEKYRPIFHYTVPKGWLGHPTGLVFDGHLFHLFARYTPDSLIPGPSHWLHVISPNLINWNTLGTVITPRGLTELEYNNDGWVGEATDGSAILDTVGLSGCGKDAIVLFWTDRAPNESTPTGYIEHQRVGCLYAADNYDSLSSTISSRRLGADDSDEEFLLATETPYIAPYRLYDIFFLRNDIEDNPPYYAPDGLTTIADYESDFRAPKIFNSGNTWHLAFANCDRFVVYSATHIASDYRYRSSWGSREGAGLSDIERYHTPICNHTYEGTWGAMGNSWEMPDLVPLLSSTNTIWWVAFVSVASPSDPERAKKSGPNGGSGTQYFIGQFDGGRFLPVGDQGVGIAEWVDYGFDFYAVRSISNPHRGFVDILRTNVTIIGWMNNELYSSSLPTSPWRGGLTLARRVKVQYLDSTPHLSQEFLGLENLRHSIHKQSKGRGDDSIPAIIVPETGWFEAIEINVTWKNVVETPPGLELVGRLDSDDGEQTLSFGVRASPNGTLFFFVERPPGGFDKNFDEMTTAVAPRKATTYTNVSMQVVIDRSSIELLADGGLVSMTLLQFPTKPWKRCTFTGDELEWSWTLLDHDRYAPQISISEKSSSEILLTASSRWLLFLSLLLLASSHQ